MITHHCFVRLTPADATDAGRAANVPAPQLAIDYWHLPASATLRDLVCVVRVDEAHHRDVNHGFANCLAKLPSAQPQERP